MYQKVEYINHYAKLITKLIIEKKNNTNLLSIS